MFAFVSRFVVGLLGVGWVVGVEGCGGGESWGRLGEVEGGGEGWYFSGREWLAGEEVRGSVGFGGWGEFEVEGGGIR